MKKLLLALLLCGSAAAETVHYYNPITRQMAVMRYVGLDADGNAVIGTGLPTDAPPNSMAVAGKLYLSNAEFGGDEFAQWTLNDNAATAVVLSSDSDVNGSLTGGNTADVAASVGGHSAFRLNGAGQYVTIPIPKIQSRAMGRLWTKYTGNPVLTDPLGVRFGQLARNPAGGYWFYGSDGTNIVRWSSADLKTWATKTQVLAGGGAGAWDQYLQVASVFQKPSDRTWVMLYRGYNGTTFQMGMATSADGAAFAKKDNGGVDDGKFTALGANYDPTAVMLVGTRYYVYTNGDPDHGYQNIYYSDDDFATFRPAPNNPLFGGLTYCMGVWAHAGQYYALVPIDLDVTGSDLYDHGLQLWRASTPFFAPGQRDFLGYALVNDQVYDVRYVDTPSVPTMDVYRTYAPEFGNQLWAMYTSTSLGSPSQTQSLISIPLSVLPTLQRVLDMRTAVQSEVAFSVWLRFDTLTDGMPVLSVADTPTSGSPRWFLRVKTSGANKVLSLLAGGDYRDTTLPLAVDTTYHVVITTDGATTYIYVNGTLVGSTPHKNTSAQVGAVYLGSGYPGPATFDGYMWDFRMYPGLLTDAQVARLYETGMAGAP
jgi:hypothetical protein